MVWSFRLQEPAEPLERLLLVPVAPQVVMVRMAHLEPVARQGLAHQERAVRQGLEHLEQVARQGMVHLEPVARQHLE
jgi:hypothetical protein